jgi:hypothetical protein
MGVVEPDQLATIHRLAAEFVTELEGRGFHRPQIAKVMTALGVNLAAACDAPGALALVMQAALDEMNPPSRLADGGKKYGSDAAIAALRPARPESHGVIGTDSRPCTKREASETLYWWLRGFETEAEVPDSVVAAEMRTSGAAIEAALGGQFQRLR